MPCNISVDMLLYECSPSCSQREEEPSREGKPSPDKEAKMQLAAGKGAIDAAQIPSSTVPERLVQLPYRSISVFAIRPFA